MCNQVSDCLITYGAGMYASNPHMLDHPPDFVKELVSSDIPGDND